MTAEEAHMHARTKQHLRCIPDMSLCICSTQPNGPMDFLFSVLGGGGVGGGQGLRGKGSRHSRMQEAFLLIAVWPKPQGSVRWLATVAPAVPRPSFYFIAA